MAFSVSGVAQILGGILPTLQPLAAEIEQLSRSSPETIAKVQTAMDGVTAGLAALGQADSMVSAAPIISRIEADVEAVLGVASSIPLPGPAGMALRIASMVIPVAFMAVSMIIASAQPVPARASRR